MKMVSKKHVEPVRENTKKHSKLCKKKKVSLPSGAVLNDKLDCIRTSVSVKSEDFCPKVRMSCIKSTATTFWSWILNLVTTTTSEEAKEVIVKCRFRIQDQAAVDFTKKNYVKLFFQMFEEDLPWSPSHIHQHGLNMEFSCNPTWSFPFCFDLSFN